jgi:hypothetical protein
MVSRQTFAVTQLRRSPVAVLAPIVISGKEKGIGYLTAETARDMNVTDQSDDGRAREYQAFAAHDQMGVGLDDFGLTVDDKTQRTPHRY